jgi:hypothetical protein
LAGKKKQHNFKIVQRKFKLKKEEEETVGGYTSLPEIHISHTIMYIHLKYFKINIKYFVYEHLCKVGLNFAILHGKKKAILRK